MERLDMDNSKQDIKIKTGGWDLIILVLWQVLVIAFVSFWCAFSSCELKITLLPTLIFLLLAMLPTILLGVKYLKKVIKNEDKSNKFYFIVIVFDLIFLIIFLFRIMFNWRFDTLLSTTVPLFLKKTMYSLLSVAVDNYLIYFIIIGLLVLLVYGVYKIFDDKRILGIIITSIVLFIFLSAVIYEQWEHKRYNCLNDQDCVTNRAIEKNDIFECSSLNKIYDYRINQEACVAKFVRETKMKPEDCDILRNSSDYFMQICISETKSNVN